MTQHAFGGQAPAFDIIRPPVTKSMRVEGSLHGLLLDLHLRQTYRNDSKEDLNISSVFPLGHEAVLLGLEVTFAGKTLRAEVFPEAEAIEQFDAALQAGDSPVRLSIDSLGNYVAELGNLKPGEEMAVDLHMQQMQRFDKGRIRVRIPTALGVPFVQGPDPDNKPASGDARRLAEGYRAEPQLFELCIDLLGEAARGAVKSPSHKLILNTFDEGKPTERLQVRLGREAYLNQDFILSVDVAAGQGQGRGARKNLGLAMAAPEWPADLQKTQSVALVAFDPAIPNPVPGRGANSEAASDPLALKILLDCSGSMDGPSMRYARAALLTLLEKLQPEDRVSFSRFGDVVEHDVDGLMAPCRPAHLGRLREAVLAADATLGGTELDDALHSCIHDLGQGYEGPVDVLLITDGAVDDTHDIARAAVAKGHRISVIGVGMGPGGRVIQTLASSTGGGALFAHPGESLEEAVGRAFERLRERRASDIRLEWGEGLDAKVLWQKPLPISIYAGDTVLAMARFDVPAADLVAAMKPRLHWRVGSKAYSCGVSLMETSLHGQESNVARLVASCQAADLQDSEALQALGMQYGLQTSATNFFLVHERAAKDKGAEGGTGANWVSMTPMPLVGRMDYSLSVCGGESMLRLITQSMGPDDEWIESGHAVGLDGLLELFYEQIQAEACSWRTISEVSALRLEPTWEATLGHMETLGLSRDFGMVLLLLWLLQKQAKTDGLPMATDQALIWLQEVAIDLAPALQELATASFEAADWHNTGKAKAQAKVKAQATAHAKRRASAAGRLASTVVALMAMALMFLLPLPSQAVERLEAPPAECLTAEMPAQRLVADPETGELAAQALCCCTTHTGQSCCNYVTFCGSFVPGCACRIFNADS